MAKSLQEQLMGAGLVDKKKAKTIQKEQRTKRKQTPKGKSLVDETKERVEQQQKEKVEKDRELNRRKQEEQNKKAVRAQVIQLVKLNEVKRDQDATEAFQFAVNKKIKKLYVTVQQQNDLSKGRLTIAEIEGEFFLIPNKVADKIEERDEMNTIVYRYEGQMDSVDEDDPYKDFVVPDDLMW